MHTTCTYVAVFFFFYKPKFIRAIKRSGEGEAEGCVSLRRAPSVPPPALGAGPGAAEPVRAFAPHTDPTGPLLMNSSPKGG